MPRRENVNNPSAAVPNVILAFVTPQFEAEMCSVIAVASHLGILAVSEKSGIWLQNLFHFPEQVSIERVT